MMLKIWNMVPTGWPSPDMMVKIASRWASVVCAVVEGAGKEVGGGNHQTAQVGIAEMALVDFEGDGAVAMAVGRRSHRLAGAAVIAAAVFEPLSLNSPWCVCHLVPLPVIRCLRVKSRVAAILP
jgi:hypothetical protein